MTTPQQPAKPAPQPPAPQAPTQPRTAAPANGPPDQPKAPDPPVVTAAEEQRARSEAMQAEGVERVKARLDERDPNARPRSVAGVGQQAGVEAERSTPPARAAQNKAAP